MGTPEPPRRRVGPDRPGTVVEAPGPLEDDEEWIDLWVSGLDLTASEIDQPSLVGCFVQASRLAATCWDDVTLNDSRLEDCDLSGAEWARSSWLRVQVQGGRLRDMAVPDGQLRHVAFEDCNLAGASFRFARANTVAFENCDLTGADLSGAALEDCRFAGCDLRGALFHQARLRDVRFDRCRLDDLVGARALAGSIVSPDSALVLGLALMSDLGIRLEDAEDS